MSDKYTREELKDMVGKMQAVSNNFYPQACHTGVHPFIEFCGLMNKYIDVCRKAAEDEVQFPFANEHSRIPLPVEPHDLEYLAEKLRCIFGPIIDSNPEAKALFERELLGKGARHAQDLQGR